MESRRSSPAIPHVQWVSDNRERESAMVIARMEFRANCCCPSRACDSRQAASNNQNRNGLIRILLSHHSSFLPTSKYALLSSHLSPLTHHCLAQMTDSYADSTNGDALTPNGTSKMNGSSPSLSQPQDSGSAPIIRKKLNGYVGFANLPNQVHRKSVRKGFQFTAMVVGTWQSPALISTHNAHCL